MDFLVKFSTRIVLCGKIKSQTNQLAKKNSKYEQIFSNLSIK